MTSSPTSRVTPSSPDVRTSAMTRPSPSRTSASGCCRSSSCPRQPSYTWATCCTSSAWRKSGKKRRRRCARQTGSKRRKNSCIEMVAMLEEEEEEAAKRRSRQSGTNMAKSVSEARCCVPMCSTLFSRPCLKWDSFWASIFSMASS